MKLWSLKSSKDGTTKKIEVADPEVYRSFLQEKIRNENFEQILRLIEYSCPVEYEIKDTDEVGTVPHILISKKTKRRLKSMLMKIST
jgi:hypothetical protein